MNSDTIAIPSAEKFKGVIAPTLLPLAEDKTIDYKSLDCQLDFLLAGKVDGIWVNGTTGEFFALTDSERSEVIEASVKGVARRAIVIAHVGDTSTRKTLIHGARAVEAGVDCVSVVPPYYMTYSQTELKQHFRTISKELGIPIFLYQIPQTCKVSLTISSIIELAREGVLIGLKDSAGDVDFYHSLLREVAKAKVNLRCFYGVSSLVDMGLYASGHGVMSAIANLVPHLCKQACEQAEESNWSAVHEINLQILQLMDTLHLPGRQGMTPLVAVYKWILKELGIIATNKVFAPLQPLTKEEQTLLYNTALPLAKKLCADVLEHA